MNCSAGPSLFKHVEYYNVADFRIRVGADSPDLLQSLRALLGIFRVEAISAPGWKFVAHRSQLDNLNDLHADLKTIWSGPIFPRWQAVNSAGPGVRRLELVDCGRLDLDLRVQQARLTLAPHTNPTVADYFLMPLLCEGLSQAGHYPMHAASLEVSAAGEPASVLIVAKSGTGKSTTALALANAGWKLMGDDLALLCKQDGQLAAWGFPRLVHVRRPSLKLLPWLNELPLIPTSVADTFDLPLSALGARACIPKSRPRKPALMIILERPNSQAHRCQPLDRATALAALAHENVQPIEGCGDRHAHTAFSWFAELVQQTPAYQLSAGPKLETLAEFLRAETGIGHG